MIYKFKAHNYLEAYDWFISLPSYSIKNFLRKDDLRINSEHIKNIEIVTSQIKKITYLNYSDDYHFGKIEIRNLNLGDFKNVSVIQSDFDSWKFFKEHFLDFKFYIMSPLSVLTAYFAIVGTLFIDYRHQMFPGILHPKPFINALCNEKCVSLSSLGIFALSFLFIMTYGAVILGVVLAFFSKYYSNLKHYKLSLHYLMIFFLVQFSLITMATVPLFDSRTFKGVKLMFQVRYDNEFIRTHTKRDIASEHARK